MERAEHLAHISSDIDAFIDAVDAGRRDAEIAGCPGWTLADLGAHLGGIHRWVIAAVRGIGPPAGPLESPPEDPCALADWLRAGGAEMLEVLHALAPDAPTWHPFPVPRVGAIWLRRQAQENSVHRWDAQRAIGMAPSIDAPLAADGIDEYWTLALPRLVARRKVELPDEPLRVRADDTGQEWIIASRDGEVVVLDDAGGHDVAGELGGDATPVLLRLWGRPVDEGAVRASGVARRWLALGGM